MKCQTVKDIKNLVFRFNDDDILALASMLSYSLILSLFPFLIFLMTLAGYSNLNSDYLILQLKPVLPDSAYALVSASIREILSIKNGSLLSLSFIFMIFSASSGFRAVIKGLNKAYDEEEHRSFIKIQVLSISCTFGLTAIIIITIFLLVFGQIITSKLAFIRNYSYAAMVLWNSLRYLIILSSMLFVFACLYRYTPCRKLKWSEVVPGSIFSTIGWIIVSVGFSFYVNNFGNYSKVYGSIGAVIVLMTWVFLSSIIIILGGELNATIAFDREGKLKPKGKNY